MTTALFTMNGAATETGRDRKTITRALRGVSPDGKSGRWDAWRLTTILDALDANGTTQRLDLTAERARLAKAQAEKAERENKIADGLYLEMSSFHRMATTSLLIVRSKLLAIPPKLATYLVRIETPAEAQEILRKAIYATLDELAATDLAKYDHSNEFATRSIADVLFGEQESA